MLKNEVKKPSYLVGSRLGSILGDFLRKLGDFFSKSSGHTAVLRTPTSSLLEVFELLIKNFKLAVVDLALTIQIFSAQLAAT